MRRYFLYTGILLAATYSIFPNYAEAQADIEIHQEKETKRLDRTNPPPPGPAPEIKLGEYEFFELDNGLKVYVVTNEKIPRISYSLHIDRDPVFEGHLSGYLQIVGDLISRGTLNMTKAEIDEEIDFIGASFSTSSKSMYGSSLTRHTEELLSIMGDVLTNPVFPQEELDKLVKLAQSDLAAEREEPSAIVNNIRNLVVYGADHPFGEMRNDSSIVNISREDCIRYYEQYWSPKKAYLAVVGDIDIEEAKGLIPNYFGSWGGGPLPEHEYPVPELPERTKVVLVDRPASVQSEIRVSYPVDLKTRHADFFAAKILNNILGGTFTSRLNQNLREEHGYAYSAGSGISANDIIGRFTAGASVRNEVTDSAVHEILYEMDNIAEHGITEKELKDAKAYMTGSFARSLERPQTIAGFAINTIILQLPKDFYHNYLKKLDEVTIEDVNAAAKKFIKPDNAYIIVVGNGDEIVEGLRQFGPVEYYDVYGNVIGSADALTAESILNRHIKEIGGAEKLRQVRNQKQVWEMKMYQQDAKMEFIKTSNGEFYSEFILNGELMEKVICNGVDMVVYEGDEPVEMDAAAKEAEMINTRLFPELHYLESGCQLSLEGVEDVNGRKAYVILISYPLGKRANLYIDVEYGLVVREVIETDPNDSTSEEEAITILAHQEIDGVLYPKNIQIQHGPMIIESTLVSVENDIKIDPDLFKIK